MLHTTLPPSFPYPGSTAHYEGLSWRVVRHHGDGTALISRDDPRASGARTVPLGALTDPDLAGIPVDGLDRRTVDQLRWLRDRLRTANSVVFQSLRAELRAAAREGHVPAADSHDLAGLLRRLGWRRTAVTATSTIWSRKPAEMVL